MFRIRVTEIFIQALFPAVIGRVHHLDMDPKLVTRFHTIFARRFNSYVPTRYLDI